MSYTQNPNKVWCVDKHSRLCFCDAHKLVAGKKQATFMKRESLSLLQGLWGAPGKTQAEMKVGTICWREENDMREIFH